MKKSGLDKLIEQVIAEKTLGTYTTQFRDGTRTGTKKKKIADDLGLPTFLGSRMNDFIKKLNKIDINTDGKLEFPEELEFELIDTNVPDAAIKGRFSSTSGGRRDRNLIRASILFDHYNVGEVKKYLESFYDVFDEKANYNEEERKWRLALFSNYYTFFRNLNAGDDSSDLKSFVSKMQEKNARILAPTKTPRAATKDAETVSITDPTFATQAAASGKMLETQFVMFNKFFEGTTGNDPKTLLTQRIQKLTKFSNDVATAKDNLSEALTDEQAKGSITDFLNKTMVLDYFNTFAKDVDSGAGAYIFEAFCAYMAGGTVGGKETGASGGMGEADFFFADGTKGSAKYLKAGSAVSQSFNNFIIGQTVTYIFASKKGKNKAPASDADEVLYIDLYVFNVEKEEDSLIKGKAKFKVDGVSKLLPMAKSKVVFPTPDKPVGTLALVTTSGENIQKNLNAAAGKVDTMVEQATKAFIATMSELKKAKESVQNYSNTGDMKPHGKNATESLNNAGSQFKKVMDAMQNKSEPETDDEPQNIKKESKSSMDNLIEAIIKQKLLK
jgi:hypothetical protein